MKAFRILLALAVAGATFYSLNALAVQNGYRDRLDFKNQYYHKHNCKDAHRKSHVFSHHTISVDTGILSMERVNKVK